MRNRILIGLSLALAVAAGILAAWTGTRPVAHVAASSVEPPTVAVVKVGRQDMAKTMTVTGELIPFQEVEVMAKVAGYVQKMYVDVGDHVRQGQVIAVLELPEMIDDLTRSAAAIQRHKADLERAREELHRAESGYQMTHLTYKRLAGVSTTQPGLVAQQEIDDAQARDLMAAAQVAAAKSSLDSATEQIRVAQAEDSKLKTLQEYTRVTAPFPGVITSRYADTGSMIQAGTASRSQALPLVRLSENSLLRLVLPIPESASDLVRNGSQLEVRIPTLNKVFTGKVARTADKVDTSTRTMRVEVDVPNPSGALIPGMYAEVTLTLAESRNALVVPLSAIRQKEGEWQVWAVDAGGRAHLRRIRTGMASSTASEIKSGLEEGELVVVSNPNQLVEGQMVKTKIEFAAGKGGDA